MLHCAARKAREGAHQYLSGTLHNVAKALAHAQPRPDMHSALLAAGYGSSEPFSEGLAVQHCWSGTLSLRSD